MSEPSPRPPLPERLRQHAHDLIHGGTNASWLRQDLEEAADALVDAVNQRADQQEELRMGHVRLDETRAKEVQGPLYDRISWIIDLLTRERSEVQAMLNAVGCEIDEQRAKAGAAEHRRVAAEYRAQRIVLDAEIKARAERAEVLLTSARQERDKLRGALVGLVGVDGREELEQLEIVMRVLPAPEEDRAATVDAIHALLASLDVSTQTPGQEP